MNRNTLYRMLFFCKRIISIKDHMQRTEWKKFFITHHDQKLDSKSKNFNEQIKDYLRI